MTQVVELMPRTGLEMPDADQLQRLRSYVLAEHGWLRAGAPEAEFERAFWVVGTFHRRPTCDSSVYYAHWVSTANARLERAGLAPIGGQSFLCACISQGVVWQKPDSGVGALLELGLNEFSGQPCDNSFWRGLLAGERGLLKPVLRDRGIARQDGIRVVRSAPE